MSIDSVQHIHEHEGISQDSCVLHSTVTNRSYHDITAQGQSNNVFGDVSYHYHIRPSHAIAHSPDRVIVPSDDAEGPKPAVSGSDPEFPSWLLPFEQRNTFFGRKGLLNQIEGVLFPGHGLFRAAITGLGGAGKSRCAMEIAYRVKRKRPLCSIFWIQGTDLKSIHQGYRNIAEALHLPTPGDNPERIMESVRSHLSSEQASEFLLIIDDADDSSLWLQRRPGPHSPQPLVMDCIPGTSKGAIIVTTRSHQVATQIAQRNVYQLPKLDRKDAGRLLQSRLSDTAEGVSADARAIAHHLECLPFALVRAADFANQNGTDLRTLLQLLQDGEEAVAQLLSSIPVHDELYDGESLPARKTWLVSIGSIKLQNEHAFNMLTYMSCLYHLSIPQELILTARSGLHHVNAIGLLQGYGLISSIKEEENTMFKFHWLAYVAVRDWLHQRSKFRSTLEATITMVCGVLQQHSDKQLEVRRIQTFWPHIKQLCSSGRKLKIQSRCSLLGHAANLFKVSKLPKEELKCLDLLARDSEIENVFPPRHIGNIYTRLGHLLLARNSPEKAEEWLRKAVDNYLHQDLSSQDPRPTSELVGDAILVWDQTGKLGATMVLAQELVDKLVLKTEPEDPDTTDIIRTWAEACLKLCESNQSHVIKSDELEKLVRLCKDRLGKGDELTRRSQCALTELQLQLPENSRDETFVQGAIYLFDRVLGRESQQSVSARQLLDEIQRTATELQAKRARDFELAELSRNIDRPIVYARSSEWSEAAEALSELSTHQKLLDSKVGDDAILLKGIHLYTVHRQGREQESLQLATDLMDQNSRLESSLSLLLQRVACSAADTDPSAAASLLERLAKNSCWYHGPSDLVERLVKTLRKRGETEQAISLLWSYSYKFTDRNGTTSINFWFSDFLFPPGFCSWPRWLPQGPPRRQKPDRQSWQQHMYGVMVDFVFRGNDELLLMKTRWRVDQVISRLELEAECPGYQRDWVQFLKTGIFLAFLYLFTVLKILVFLVGAPVFVVVLALYGMIEQTLCGSFLMCMDCAGFRSSV